MASMNISEALELYLHAGLHELGARAHQVCCTKHPEAWRTFIVDRNINYTNVCVTRCRFCAFSVDEGDQAAYVLPTETLLAKIDELVQAGGTQVLLQGGMHGSLGLEFYVQMLRDIRRNFPSVQIHAFSPPEIWFFSQQFGLTVGQVLARLVEAGLDSIPGGGAEILVDRVRRLVSPQKCSAAQWLDVMEQAHAIGLNTTATMMLGHLETPAERIEHLLALRELQGRSLARGKGHFTAFICWTFQPQNTPLAADELTSHKGNAAADGPASFSAAGAIVYLRTLAMARLVLDNFDNVQASWVTQGPKVGQLALFYGANDMGGVMMEENVVAAAGTSFRLDRRAICRLISEAGYQPRQRDGFYRLMNT
jgi:dehypoxanthine futalosine cyclase